MSAASTMKGISIGLLLLFSYINMVLGAVAMSKSEEVYSDYPPASVALMVAGAVQLIHLLGYFVWSKTRAYSGSNFIVVTGLCTAFTFGATVALTVLRLQHNSRYCPAGPAKAGDCAGVLRAQFGLGWASFGWDLISLVLIPLAISKSHASFSTPLGYVPRPETRGEQDPEKAQAAAH